MTPAELAARLAAWPAYAERMVGDSTQIAYAHLQAVTPVDKGNLLASEHIAQRTGTFGVIAITAPYAAYVALKGTHNQVPNEYPTAAVDAALPDVDARLAAIADAFFRGAAP